MRLSFIALSWLVFCAAIVNIGSIDRAQAQSATTPLADIRTTIDQILKIVGEYPSDDQKDLRREKLRILINPKFNFAEMSRRSLGTFWNEITPEEQEEFSRVFSNLLARTYLSKIETVKPGMVTVDKEEVSSDKAVVKTTVTSKGSDFPIDYKLQLDKTNWQVYDVVIENIGLVTNYRSEFAGIIRKEKFSGLMQRLKDKS